MVNVWHRGGAWEAGSDARRSGVALALAVSLPRPRTPCPGGYAGGRAPAAAARKPRRSNDPQRFRPSPSLIVTAGKPDPTIDFYRTRDTKASSMTSKSAPLLPDAVGAPVTVRFEHGPDLGIGSATRGSPGSCRPRPPISYRTGTKSRSTKRFAGRVASRSSSPGRPNLCVRAQLAQVRVRVCGGETWSPWSEVATVEAGLLAPEDWSARFVSPAGVPGAPVLRASLEVPGPVARARLYATRTACTSRA